MTDQPYQAAASDYEWKSLYTIGGVAALVAGVAFRRNIAAEVGLFTGRAAPLTVANWYLLLQNNRLLGLVYLNILDLVNYALLALMFLALYVALKQASKICMTIAMLLALVGITVYFASNTAFSMLSLSDQYSAATTDGERSILVAAGQAMLALNRFGDTNAHPGTGGYVSLLLVAVAGMSISVVMLRSTVFSRPTAVVGILAATFDLAYCIAYVFLREVDSRQLALFLIPAAGLLLAIWHILTGLRLLRLGCGISKAEAKVGAQ
jgi:hypothetical protein